MRMTTSRLALAVVLAPMLLAGGTASAQEVTTVEEILSRAGPNTLRELEDRADAVALAMQQEEDVEQATKDAALGPITRPTPEALVVALELARLANNEETIIRAGSARAREAFLDVAASNEDLTATEKKHPGFLAAYWEEVEPVVDRSARERVPALQELQAATYAANLPVEELRWMRCMITALGDGGLKTVVDSASTDETVASMKEASDFVPDAAALRRDVDASRKAGVAALGEDRLNAMVAACPRTTPPPDTLELSYKINGNVMVWGLGETEWEAAELDKAMQRALARVGAK